MPVLPGITDRPGDLGVGADLAPGDIEDGFVDPALKRCGLFAPPLHRAISLKCNTCGTPFRQARSRSSVVTNRQRKLWARAT